MGYTHFIFFTADEAKLEQSFPFIEKPARRVRSPVDGSSIERPAMRTRIMKLDGLSHVAIAEGSSDEYAILSVLNELADEPVFDVDLGQVFRLAKDTPTRLLATASASVAELATLFSMDDGDFYVFAVPY